MIVDDRQLYYAALSRASHHGETREIRALRDYTHTETMAGRIDAATQDRIGRLIDALSRKNESKVGDLIGYNAADIPWDVLEVRDDEGTAWQRAFGNDRYLRNDDGSVNDLQDYDWLTEGGACTTEGLLFYKPLLVTRVATLPEED